MALVGVAASSELLVVDCGRGVGAVFGRVAEGEAGIVLSLTPATGSPPEFIGRKVEAIVAEIDR